MKLAILETGTPPDELIPSFGRYPEMFGKLLGLDVESYDVAAGALPSHPARHEAYLITGSPAGVYEDRPWIGGLLDFLRSTPAETKLVGICFGHQAMAQAFGGRVEKSPKGWGVGLQRYEVVRREPWMDPWASEIFVPASHQDQVVEQPPESDVTSVSAFTPLAGLVWRNRAAISFQFHPEFEPAYAKALIKCRRDRLPDPAAAAASLDRPNENSRLGKWIRNFLEK